MNKINNYKTPNQIDDLLKKNDFFIFIIDHAFLLCFRATHALELPEILKIAFIYVITNLDLY